MKDFLMLFLKCSVSMSAVSVAYLLLTPLISKRYSAKWRYAVWIVISVCWLIPFRPQITVPVTSVENIPEVLIAEEKPVPPIQMDASESFTFAGYGEEDAEGISVNTTPGQLPVWHIAMVIWLVGALAFIAYYGGKHYKFTDIVRRWGEPVTDTAVNDLLVSLKAELKIKRNVRLKQCPYINTPLLFGIIHPVILLPCIDIPNDRLAFILRHELIHLKRHDLLFKLLNFLALSIHWFNPAAYFASKAASAQCELSCDDMVLSGSDKEQRRYYGETIIGIVRDGMNAQTILTTNFYGGKNEMTNRIISIMDNKKKKVGITLLCVVLIATFAAGISFSAIENSVKTEEPKLAKTANAERLNEAIELLSEYSLIKESEANNFDAKITRQELTLFIARIYSKTPKAFDETPTKTSKFADVTDSAYVLAIEFCTEDPHKIINAKDAEKNLYCPEDTVTVQEAAEFILGAIGYKEISPKSAVIPVAIHHGVFEGFAETFTEDLSHEITRGEAVLLMQNYFNGEYVELTWDTDPDTGETKIERKFRPVNEVFKIMAEMEKQYLAEMEK